MRPAARFVVNIADRRFQQAVRIAELQQQRRRELAIESRTKLVKLLGVFPEPCNGMLLPCLQFGGQFRGGQLLAECCKVCSELRGTVRELDLCLLLVLGYEEPTAGMPKERRRNPAQSLGLLLQRGQRRGPERELLHLLAEVL